MHSYLSEVSICRWAIQGALGRGMMDGTVPECEIVHLRLDREGATTRA